MKRCISVGILSSCGIYCFGLYCVIKVGIEDSGISLVLVLTSKSLVL